MSIYIGGDSQELSFDFGLKVANSVAECPLRLFRGEVSPDSLPPPTDGVWTEVTSQTMLSKLASQNELPVTAIATDKSTVTWNGKTLPKTAILKVLDDFVGKISGSVVENPHIGKWEITTTLNAPSNVAFTEFSQANGYDKVKTLDSVIGSATTSLANNIPQQLFSFNIIEMFERKFGAIPKETTAEKVAWLKSNLSQIVCNWTGYGSGPLGNKAYLDYFDSTNNFWAYKNANHPEYYQNTASSATLITFSSSIVSNKIDSDGFVHFLAYTDSARTTDSTLLVLSGHGLSNSDVIENTTRNIYSTATKGTYNTLITGSITGQTSGDSIKKFKYTGAGNIKTITAIDGNNITIPSHGLSTGDFIKNTSRSWTLKKVTVVDANTITLDSAITGQVVGDSIAFYTLYGIQTTEATVIPSTIYTDYVSLELTLKAPENLITATNTLSDIVTDFTGKVSGSVVENANVSKAISTSLQSPASFTFEQPTASYDLFKTLNGVTKSEGTSTNTNIPQQLFSFNIVSAVEKQLGQSIPAVDKVQWCKDFVKSLKCDWTGYGSTVGGSKAYLDYWNVNTVAWQFKNTSDSNSRSNSTSSPSLIGIELLDTNSIGTPSKSIDSNGFVNFLAYTDASDGNTASTIFTDYVKLTIKLKYIPTYDFYTDSNTRRDAGLTDIVLVKRTIGDMVSDFTGKVSGSVVENPNIAKYIKTSSLQVPNAFSTEDTDAYYNLFKTLDGNCFSVTTTTNGQISQALFQFNLIEIAQRALGTSIPGADTASKVQWLKDNINTLRVDWYGYGSCPSGNRANLDCYANSTRGWDWYGGAKDGWDGWKHTLSSITNLYISNFNGGTASQMIYDDGFVNILASAPASDGVTPSVINTDYIKLTLTFKSDTVGYEYFTNNSAEVSVTTNAKASAYLIECDLTPIATSLYGGSNAALKSALKSISADVYAMGSGANVNQLGNGVVVSSWTSDVTRGLKWAITDIANFSTHWFSSSATSSISNRNINLVSSDISWGSPVNTTNKIYIIVYSTYKSDGAIASEVNLDYVNIKVNLTRTPDVISNPPTIELTDTWSMLVRGFSPSWDSFNHTTTTKTIFSLYKDNSNFIAIRYDGINNQLYLIEKLNNNFYNQPMYNVKNKYQVFNVILSRNNNQLTVKGLFNCDLNMLSTIKSLNTTDFNGYKILPLCYGTTSQADAFLDSIVYLPNQTFDDATAEAILRGTKEGFEMPELFDINAVTLHANATRSNGVITLNATGNYQFNYINIPVLPNNQYSVSYVTNNGKIELQEFYNNISLGITNQKYDSGIVTFTTSPKTNKIYLLLQNGSRGAGTFTFSNISLKLKM